MYFPYNKNFHGLTEKISFCFAVAFIRFNFILVERRPRDEGKYYNDG